ncbi:hypothetical protein [Pseudanabaena sp. BC1403]|nr:hypothetical protein [Pseudanabaena sp. BC1403]
MSTHEHNPAKRRSQYKIGDRNTKLAIALKKLETNTQPRSVC